MRKILVINSATEKNFLLARAFKELERKEFSFALMSSKKPLLEQFRTKNWPAKKTYLGPDLKNSGNLFFFILILLPLQIKFLLHLAGLKLRRRVDLIVCLSLNEKIIITPVARLLGLKVVWLEGTELNYQKFNKFLSALYKLNFKLARTAVFNNYSKTGLKNMGCEENKIILAAPGTELSQYQENIFNKLAHAGRENFNRKYFTIGSVTALNQKQKIEAIFQAIKICLPVIPNIQLIIIGAGGERKSLLWLSKKMEIENLVWLVGEQGQLKKWLDSFDVFLASGDGLTLDDYGNILEAMSAELPILAPRNTGVEDLVAENKTGSLIEPDNSEMLARQIIRLYQDKRLRLFLGKNGRERVSQLFTLDKMAGNLEEILK